jgi:TPR repeat protein
LTILKIVVASSSHKKEVFPSDKLLNLTSNNILKANLIMSKFICILVFLSLSVFGNFAYSDAKLQAATQLWLKKEYPAALENFKILAEQGSPDAQVFLGDMYQNGLGTPQDYDKALRWFRLAAEQGHSLGQLSLGLMHLGGFGTESNKLRAHMWFNLAGMHGNKDANEMRSGVAELLTKQQVGQAQRMANDCLAKSFKGCD